MASVLTICSLGRLEQPAVSVGQAIRVDYTTLDAQARSACCGVWIVKSRALATCVSPTPTFHTSLLTSLPGIGKLSSPRRGTGALFYTVNPHLVFRSRRVIDMASNPAVNHTPNHGIVFQGSPTISAPTAGKSFPVDPLPLGRPPHTSPRMQRIDSSQLRLSTFQQALLRLRLFS